MVREETIHCSYVVINTLTTKALELLNSKL